MKEKEYIIRDKMTIMEEDKDNGYIALKLNVNSDEDFTSDYLKKVMETCKNSGFNKLNIYTEKCFSVFSNLGFEVEGIINKRTREGARYIYGVYLSENAEISENIPVLYGSRITLKIFKPEDSKALLDYQTRNREYLQPFDPLRKEEFFTIDTQRIQIEKNFGDYLNNRGYDFGIYKDGNLIGRIHISSIVYGVFHNAFIGYSIDENEQRKGYMKETLKLASDFCFNELDIHRIEASTLVDNIPSQKVLLGSGFKKIGYCPNYLFINGKWRDHYTYYKLRNKYD